jgi:hypothetical protein
MVNIWVKAHEDYGPEIEAKGFCIGIRKALSKPP